MASEDTFDDVKEALLAAGSSFEYIQNMEPLKGFALATNIGRIDLGERFARCIQWLQQGMLTTALSIRVMCIPIRQCHGEKLYANLNIFVCRSYSSAATTTTSVATSGTYGGSTAVA